MGFIPDGNGGKASFLAMQLTSTSSNPYADLLLDVPAARLDTVDGLFNAAGIQLQVLTLDGLAYRPYRDAVAAFNADVADFWAERGTTARALARFRSVATSPAIVSHTMLAWNVAPTSSLQPLHPHDSGFRLYGNQFALTAYDWNHPTNCTISGGTITSNNDFDQSFATGSPAFGNSGSGLRSMFTVRHNQANDYTFAGYLNGTAAPSPTGSNFAASFYISQGTTVAAWVGASQRAAMPYGGELLALENWDDGLKWYVGATLLYHDPNPPAELLLYLGVLFHSHGSAWVNMQAGGQTTTPR